MLFKHPPSVPAAHPSVRGSGGANAQEEDRPCIRAARWGAPANVNLVMKRIRVLVVDDDAKVRKGLAMRIGAEPDMALAGEAGDGVTALRLATELRPDVVLMDVLMPGTDGIAATSAMVRAVPGCIVIAISVRDDGIMRQRAVAAGAAGLVAKQEEPERLLASIRQLAGGTAHGPERGHEELTPCAES